MLEIIISCNVGLRVSCFSLRTQTRMLWKFSGIESCVGENGIGLEQLGNGVMAVPHSASLGSWVWTMRCGDDPHQARSLRLRIFGDGIGGGGGVKARVLAVRCVSKSAMRVLQELGFVIETEIGAKLLVRRARGLSRGAQTEVLEALVQRGQCALVLPMYAAVREGARYKWDARLHARIVAMVSKDEHMLATYASDVLKPHEMLGPEQKGELECALIESYISQGLVTQAHEAFHRLCELPLRKARSLGYKAMARAHSATENPEEAEKMVKEMECAPSVDDYKALLLGYGKVGRLTEMERIAGEARRTGVRLDAAGFNIMISAYCAGGMLGRMVETFRQMDVACVPPSWVSWNALTKACPTLVALGVEGTGALASPQILHSRLQERAASSAEVHIVQFLLARGFPSECVIFSSDVWQLDLHSMSVGTASIVFPQWLSSVRDRIQQTDARLPVEVRLVTGWGKHSKADVKAPVRKMIMAELEALKSPFKADSKNRGAFITRGSSLKKWFSTLALG